jgi:hypothetical protein
LRAQIGELSRTIRQLRRSGLDDAAPRPLISRKRAELEDLTRRGLTSACREIDALAHELLKWYDDQPDLHPGSRRLLTCDARRHWKVTVINMCKRSSSPSISMPRRRSATANIS